MHAYKTIKVLTAQLIMKIIVNSSHHIIKEPDHVRLLQW